MARLLLQGMSEKVDVIANFNSLEFMSEEDRNDFLKLHNINKMINVGEFASYRTYARKSFDYLSENKLLDGYKIIHVHNSNPALVVRINEYIVPTNSKVLFTLHCPPENSTYQFYHKEDYVDFVNHPNCTLLGVSKNQVKRCINSLNYYKEHPEDSIPNIDYILNGITTEKYDEELVYDCGSIGRFSPTKSVLESLNCVVEITRHTGGKGFYVGTGSNYEESTENQKKFVDSMMEVLNANPQIEWFESLDNVELKKLLASSRSYISLSTIETFGLTVCEAILQGTPSIGFDVNGIGEIIEEGITGYKYPTGRSKWVKRYEQSKELYEKSILLDRNEVRRRGLERFDINRTIKEYEDLYNSIRR